MNERMKAKLNRFSLGRKNGKSLHFLTEKEGKILKIIIDEVIVEPRVTRYFNVIEIIDQSLTKKGESNFGYNVWRGKFYKLGIAYICALADIDCQNFSTFRHSKLIRKTVREIMTLESRNFATNFIRKVTADSILIYNLQSQKSKVPYPEIVLPNILAFTHQNLEKK